jgi:prepilin-type N-terminal cleavage/methylation domain-containing protein
LRNKNRLNSRGFSLLEVLVALGLLSGVGLIAAKILDMIQLNSKASARKEAQFQMQVRGVKLLKLQLKGLKKNQFILDLF